MDAASYHDIKSFLRKLYADSSSGECSILTDTHTLGGADFPFGCLSGISRG